MAVVVSSSIATSSTAAAAMNVLPVGFFTRNKRQRLALSSETTLSLSSCTTAAADELRLLGQIRERKAIEKRIQERREQEAGLILMDNDRKEQEKKRLAREEQDKNNLILQQQRRHRSLSPPPPTLTLLPLPQSPPPPINKKAEAENNTTENISTGSFVLSSVVVGALPLPKLADRQLLPWERHRPKKKEDILGFSNAIDKAQSWLKAAVAETIEAPVASKMLVITGPPGSGKSFLARSVLKSSCTITDAPTDLQKGRLTALIRSQTRIDVITRKPAALLIDDVGAVLNTEGIAPFSERCACIVVGTSTGTGTMAIPKQYTKLFKNVICLWPLSDHNAERLAQRVALAEHGRTLPIPVVTDIVQSCGGDMRQIIVSAVSMKAGISSSKQVIPSPFVAAREILTGRMPEILDFDCDYTAHVVWENVGKTLAESNEDGNCSEELMRMAVCAEDFAVLDSIDADNNDDTTSDFRKKLVDGFMVALSVRRALAGNWMICDRYHNQHLSMPKKLLSKDCRQQCGGLKGFMYDHSFARGLTKPLLALQ